MSLFQRIKLSDGNPVGKVEEETKPCGVGVCDGSGLIEDTTCKYGYRFVKCRCKV